MMDAFAAVASPDLLALAAAAGLFLLASLAVFTRQPDQFTLAGMRVPAVIGGLALAGAFLSSAAFGGLTGAIFHTGSDALAWLIGLTAGLVLLGVLIAPALRRMGATDSIPGYLTDRFGGRLLGVCCALVVLAISALLLTAQLTMLGNFAQSGFSVPFAYAVFAAAALTGFALASGGLRAVIWLCAILVLAVLAAHVIPLSMMSLDRYGSPFGHLLYGQALTDIRDLEVQLITDQLANAITLRPHTRPFLQTDPANMVAMIVSLAAGAAVLPHLVIQATATRGPSQSSMTTAWAVLVSIVVLTGVPAYAALTKVSLYEQLSKAIALADAPPAFDTDGVRVHGVSARLCHDVSVALKDGGSVERWLTLHNKGSALEWSQQPGDVRQAITSAANSGACDTVEMSGQAWRTSILPVAASAKGEQSGHITESSLSVAPYSAAPFGMALAGLPSHWQTVFAMGGILAAMATALATAWAGGRAAGTLGCLLRRCSATPGQARAGIWQRLSGLALAIAAAAAAVFCNTDAMALAALAFAIAAGGLFPVILAAVRWPWVSRAGALAGMAGGLAVTLFYMAGTQYAPVTFYDLTGALSDGGPLGHEELTFLRQDVQAAAPEQLAEAEKAVLDYARGVDSTPGAANWFGIHRLWAAIFGLPVGIILIMLVSGFSKVTSRKKQPPGR